MSQDKPQKPRSSEPGKESPVDPKDDAQLQDEPEKLHGDPIRTPGAVSGDDRQGRA